MMNLAEEKFHNESLQSAARVGRNSIFVFIARIIDVGTRILSLALIVRYLLVELFGEYAFIMAVVSFLIPLSDFGIERILVRELSRDKKNINKYISSALIIRITLSIFLILIVYLMTHIFHWDKRMVLAIYIATFSQIFTSFQMIFLSIFRAFERMQYDTILTFLHQLIKLSFIFIVIRYNLGFLALFLVIALADLLKVILQIIIALSKFLKPYFVINLSLCKYLLKESYMLGIFAFIVMASLKIDIFILQYFKGAVDISLFEVPHTIIMQFQIIPLSIVTALFPLLSRLADDSASSRSSLLYAFEKAFKFLFILALFFTLLLIIWAREVIMIVSGEKFLDAVLALQIMGVTICFIFLIPLMNFTLTSIGKQKLTTVSVIICFLINLLVDLLLVPKYGYIGAGIGTSIAYIFFFLATFYFTIKSIGMIKIKTIIFKPIVGGCIMIICSLLLKNGGFAWSLAGFAAGTLSYFISLFLLRTFSEEELSLMTNTFRIKRHLSNLAIKG